MFCGYCGKEVDNDQVFCPYCGKELKQNNSVEEVASKNEKKQSSKIIAIAVIVALVLAAVAYFVFFNKPKTEEPLADAASEEVSEEPGSNDQNLEIADAVEFNGHHYKIYDEAGYWSSAKASCEEKGGHLLTITSQEEQDFIEELIDSKGIMKHYWLGATDEETEGTWKWITGEPWGFTHWCSGQPNNTAYVDTEHGQDYLELQVTRGDQGVEEYMTWTDICDSGIAYNTVTGVSYEEAPDYNSTKYYGYICEWEE